ncbi:MAG: lipid A biosynthesis acyltransferase [Methylophilaceae bacterium 17-44-8]|nr:MAG: lipid A biosynthesis acyltransferase [Methylophilales bacterium 28-44-11]OZA05577.1 MAG: lipid A biosynthesis acyltransferase [Methylophilaceae bacterium 17-44-8]
MLKFFSRLLAQLSLKQIHWLGGWMGRMLFFFSPASALIQKSNLTQSNLVQLNIEHILNINAKESGKSLLETLAIWGKDDRKLLKLVKKIHGWGIIEEAILAKKGIIFLTPHLGCFEITSIYYGSIYPLTVLYRPSKLKFLQYQIEQGRQRNGVKLAEANTGGVRKLMQALKRGEAIGILPDQIPAEGEGEWAPFFGKPAYTMTLASKLAVKTGATVIMVFGERLPNGLGYEIHLSKVDSIATPALLNQAIETQISQKPEQYLWQYNRYKVRRHAMQKMDAPSV